MEAQNDNFKFLKQLTQLYVEQKKSVPEIAKVLNYSEGRVNYWLRKNGIKKRTISDAIYIKYNPNGDPFKFALPKNINEAKLFGLGIGLYWGEGNKANKNTVRLGNSDPAILLTFMKFLKKFFNINKNDLKFHLHVFTDIDINKAIDFWVKSLSIKKGQFYKPTITITGSLGNYRKKSEYGVLTIIYSNTKARNILVSLLKPE